MNMEALKKSQRAATWCVAVLLAGCLPARAQVVTTPITPVATNVVNETGSATLLVPYFEVDLSNPNGRNTIFTIDKGGRLDFVSVNGGPNSLNNNVATAVLAHATVWSDLGVPVFNFNVYLTGYDVERSICATFLQALCHVPPAPGRTPGI